MSLRVFFSSNRIALYQRIVNPIRLSSAVCSNRFLSTEQSKTPVPDGARHREIDLDFAELKKIVTTRPNSYMLIDVRQPWEVEERGRLPRSVNLPLPEIEEAMALAPAEFKKKYGFEKIECTGEDVIVYCCRGYRATEAKQKLKKFGLPCVKVFYGFIEYREQGGLVDHTAEHSSPQACN